MASIDTLSDDVLLEILNFHGYYDNDFVGVEREKAWQTLVHVCRRWRCIVFGSPRHLNLQLVCGTGTRARDLLDIWPAFPITILSLDDHFTDDIIAALERTDRVCQIYFRIVGSLNLEILMRQRFQELTSLRLWSAHKLQVFPDLFLGGSAPRLQDLYLAGIPFPGLRNLLLSATHLVILHHLSIPHSGYISPEGMVAALST